MKKIFIVLFIIAIGIKVGLSQETIHLQNELYKISIPEKFEKGALISVGLINGQETTRYLTPELVLFYSSGNQDYHPGHTSDVNSLVVAWKNEKEEQVTNIWELGNEYILNADKIISSTSEKVIIQCSYKKEFKVNLIINLPEGSAPPQFSFGFTSEKDGWYSLCFTGIQDIEPEKLDFLYQPLVWSWKRFPAEAVISPEEFATTAAVFTNYNNITEGLAPSSNEIPFRFATFNNSRFGFSLRTNEGLAKPMLFAPILGGAESFMKKGEKYNFSFHYFLSKGDWMDGIDYLYSDVIKLKTERQNATVTLNQTLENMIDFAMDDNYSGWVEDLKASDYRFDVPGTVKNVSALHPLSIALTTGNPEIYRRRALPMIEYMMSREKYLYAVNDEIKGQNPSHFLKGPCMEIAELVSLHQMTKGSSAAFSKETERVFGTTRKLNLVTETGGDSWQDYLAKYRMSRNPADLKKAIELTDIYIKGTTESYPKDFVKSAGYFVTEYSNDWYGLLELYEETQEQRFLDAAVVGARQMLLWMRSNPMAPDSTIVANPGNKVKGVFPGRRFESDNYEFKEYDTSTRIQEQTVPAWRTSLVGLPPEAVSTYWYGPVMLTHHAAWMLRLARLSGDEKFKDVAYNAVIGRYANFPGYYFTSMNTTVYQEPDYPLHSYLDIKYNAIFYNHVWPHIALIQDFLINDAYLKSSGKVSFPSAYSSGYAFLVSKVYGHEKGEIFGNQDLNLWLPKNAIQSSCISLNHLFARDKNDTYLVLMNTANKDIDTDLYLNQDVTHWNADKKYITKIFQSDGSSEEGNFLNGQLKVNVPAEGLIAVRINGLKNDVIFQNGNIFLEENPEAENYFREVHQNASLGTITGMLLNVSSEFSDAYVYSSATEKETKEVTLNYQVGEQPRVELKDITYPFEFSIHLNNPGDTLKLKWSARDSNGVITKTKEFMLKN